MVTGATGFIGRNLVKFLTDNGIKVYSLVRNTHKASMLPELSESVIVNCDLNNYTINISTQETILIHCAWEDINDWYTLKHCHTHYQTHYNFLKNFIDNGLSRIIVLGTRVEYGKIYGPVTSQTITQPLTSYGLAKDFLHKTLRLYQSIKKYDLIWARLFYIYGDGQDETTLLGKFDKALNDGDEYFNMTYGEQLYDFMHINDAVKSIISLINKENGTYNICSGKPISIRRFLENRAQEKGRVIKFNYGYFDYKEQDTIAIWGIN